MHSKAHWKQYLEKCRAMTDDALLDEWTSYTREMAKVGTDEVFNLLLVPFTCGIHLIALVKSSVGVEDTWQKRKIIEGVLHERGLDHHTRLQTVLVGVLKEAGKDGLMMGMNTLM